MTQSMTYRVFLREPGNPYKDFSSVDEAWSFAQSFKDQGRHKVPYIHTIKPGGPEFPTKS